MSTTVCIAKWNADQRIQSSLNRVWEACDDNENHELLLLLLQSSITQARSCEELAKIVMDSFVKKELILYAFSIGAMPKHTKPVPAAVQRKSLELLHYFPLQMESLAKTFRWFDSKVRSPREKEEWCDAVQTVLGQLSIIDENMTALKLAVNVQWTTGLSEEQWRRILWASILSINSDKIKVLSRVTRRDEAMRHRATAFLTSLMDWDVFAKRRYLAEELMVEGESVDQEFYEVSFVKKLLCMIQRKPMEDHCIQMNDIERNETMKMITTTGYDVE